MEAHNWEIEIAFPYTITSDGWVVPAKKQKLHRSMKPSLLHPCRRRWLLGLVERTQAKTLKNLVIAGM